MAVVIFAAFVCGYALRDSGFKVKVDLSEIPARGTLPSVPQFRGVEQ
jgi:hypothetical protein